MTCADHVKWPVTSGFRSRRVSSISVRECREFVRSLSGRCDHGRYSTAAAGTVTIDTSEGVMIMTDDAPAVVEIADVMPGAVRIAARDIRPTDRVYDAMGGTHALSAVRVLARSVKITRADLDWPEYFGLDEPITVERSEGVTA